MRSAIPWLLVVAAAVALSTWLLGKGDGERGSTPETRAVDAQTAGGVASAAPASVAPADEPQSAKRMLPATAPDRAAVRRALVGRVVDSEGRPIAAATLSWTPLGPEVTDTVHSRGFDVDALVAETVWSTSDAAGELVFEDPPVHIGDHASVVWITHEHYVATAVSIAPRDGGWTWPNDIAMPAGDACVVQVVDTQDTPVPGAVVTQRLPDVAADPLAARVFFRCFTADGQGRAAVASFQGEQVLDAKRGDSHAETWQGEIAPEVVLVLVGSFSVQGTVALQDGSPLPDGVVVDLVLTGENAERLLGYVEVGDDGRYGPASCPTLPLPVLLVRTRSGGIIAKRTQLPRPDAGASATVDFTTRLGSSVLVRIQDGSAAPLADARIQLYWAPGEPDEAALATATTDASGSARIGGVVPGDVYAQVEKEDYATLTGAGPYTLVGVDDEILFTLARAGELRGVCLHAGEPVTSFDVWYWTDNPQRPVKRHFDDPGGRFVLEAMPAGTCQIAAASADLPQCQPMSVSVGESGPAEVALELPAPVYGRGRVVDASSGDPIPNARVQLFVSSGAVIVDYRGDPLPVQPDGSFEILGFPPGTTAIGVTANGYGGYYDAVRPPEGQDLELGDIALERMGRLSVVLSGTSDAAFSDFCVRTEHGQSTPWTSVPASGVATLELRPAVYHVFVACPDGRQRSRWTTVGPGDNALELDVTPSGRSLLLEFADPSGRAVDLTGGQVTVSAHDDDGPSYFVVETPAGVTLTGLEGETATVDVYDALGAILANEVIALDAQADSHTVVLDDSSRRLRVVDRDGWPLPNVDVAIQALAGGSWVRDHRTDTDGVARLGGLSIDDLLVLLYRPDLGHSSGHEVSFGGDPDEEQTLVFDAEARLDLLLVDGDVPLPGAQVRLSHPIYRPFVWLASRSSAADGRVRFDKLSEDTFRVSIRGPGLWPASVELPAVPHGEPTPIQVRRLGELELVARNADGLPVADLPLSVRSLEQESTVEAWIELGRVLAPVQGMRTDSVGSLTLVGLPRGDYVWTALGADGGAVEGLVSVPPGGLARSSVLVP